MPADFVYEDGTLPTGKSDVRPIAVAPNLGVTAAEFNTVTAALLSVRTALLDGTYHGFDAGGAVSAKFAMREAAPTSGAWHLGDVVFNTLASTSLKGWICSATGDFAGSPPTFAPFGDGEGDFASGLVVGGISLNSKAILQADSTTKGFLPPRMTKTQRDAIASPTAGLVIYNSTTGKHEYYNGVRWQSRSVIEIEEALINTVARTSEFNTLLASPGHYYVGPGTYYFDGPVSVSSNVHLELHPMAIFKRKSTMPASTQMFRITFQVSNVIIEGGTWDGVKEDGLYGEATAIATDGVSDILLRNLTIKNWDADIGGARYGYGIYLGNNNHRIVIDHVKITGCTQNNMFIVGATDSIVQNSYFLDATGDSPGAGINIEPNYYYQIAQNLMIRNCVFSGNATGVTCNNHYAGDWHDISFEDCLFENNRFGGASFTGGDNPGINYRITNCKFLNNATEGAYLAGIKGLDMANCRFAGNGGLGISMFAVRDFNIANCHIHNNGSYGVQYRFDDDTSADGLFIGNSIFNNATRGVYVTKGEVASSSGRSGITFAFNKSGNRNEYAPIDWVADHLTFVGSRVQHDSGKIYQCITEGFTAASGGPTGTGSDITDNEAHWKYVMTLPVQQYGFYIEGEGARATNFTRNDGNGGNTVALIFEDQSGDDATVFTSDIIESKYSGQSGAPLTRSRAVMMEDLSGSPGGVSPPYSINTIHAAGIAAVGANTCALNFKTQTANFTPTRTVTGGTSGATGVINTFTGVSIVDTVDAGTTGTIHLHSVTGTFVDGEAITDTDGGAAVVDKAAYTYVIIASPYAKTGDGVTVTPHQMDTGLPSIQAKVVADGYIRITGAGVAAADYPFTWELLKAGSLP